MSAEAYGSGSKVLPIALGFVLLVGSLSTLAFDGFDEPAALKMAYEKLWAGGAANSVQAVEILRKTLRRNPGSAYRWCDLGEAMMETGRRETARYCFSCAADLGANSPPVLMRVANFHFLAGENPEALEYMSRILRLVHQYDGTVFNSYTHISGNIDEILKHGLPVDRRAGQAFLRYLLRGNNLSGAEKTWEWLRSHSFSDDRLASEYVDFLLRNKRYRQAVELWSRHLGTRALGYPQTTSLFNGGFEFAPTGARLGWVTRSVDGVEVGPDSEVAHSGSWSLRMRFDGNENSAYHHTSQTAVVSPGRYRFQAYLRTAEITTDQGVGFRILDPEVPARLEIWTEQIVGTSDWHAVETTFVVRPQTKLLAVQVVRRPSLKFDNRIAGTAWIDDVALETID